MTTTKIAHRSLVSLSLPKAVPALVTYATGIVNAMTGNTWFPSPLPTLAAVMAAIQALQAAETAALARTKGAVLVRNEKRAALVVLLQEIRAYIQSIADANVDNAASIIGSAGVAVRKTPTRKPRVFEAKPGPVSGSVELVAAQAAKRASYEWESSTDGGKTWVTLPVTLQARALVTGLTPGATVVFRYRPVTKTGEGDWSAPATLLVK
jgi:hypothetical protein